MPLAGRLQLPPYLNSSASSVRYLLLSPQCQLFLSSVIFLRFHTFIFLRSLLTNLNHLLFPFQSFLQTSSFFHPLAQLMLIFLILILLLNPVLPKFPLFPCFFMTSFKYLSFTNSNNFHSTFHYQTHNLFSFPLINILVTLLHIITS